MLASHQKVSIQLDREIGYAVESGECASEGIGENISARMQNEMLKPRSAYIHHMLCCTMKNI